MLALFGNLTAYEYFVVEWTTKFDNVDGVIVGIEKFRWKMRKLVPPLVDKYMYVIM